MAARFLVAGGTGNWNSTTNWSDTSGGASGFSFPVAGDTVTIDNNSVNTNLTVNVLSSCTSFVITGTYTGTVALNASLVCSSTFTLVSTMTLTTSSINNQLQFTAAGVRTSAGIVIPCGLRFGSGSGVTVTLGDNWTVTGSVQINGNNTVTQTINGNTLTINGGLQCGIGFLNVMDGTTSVVMSGTGTITCLNGSVIRNNLEINTSGTITLGAIVTYNTNTLKYTTGTIVQNSPNSLGVGGGATFTINAPLTLNQITFGTCTINGTNGFTVTNLSNTTAGTTTTWKNGNTYTINGTLTLRGTFASNIVFVSSTPGSQYNFVLTNNGATTQDVGFINCTDANSNSGLTIWDYPGSISNASNWRLLNTPFTAVANLML